MPGPVLENAADQPRARHVGLVGAAIQGVQCRLIDARKDGKPD
jgi:hypothetical protein